MFHTKEILADQLLANANDPSFYLPFSDAAANLSEEEAFWKPNDDCNSIAEIVQHLLYWNETWQKRYEKSHFGAVSTVDNNSTFIVPEKEKFNDLKEMLLEVLLKWQDLLTEEKAGMEIEGFPAAAKWGDIIANISSHNAYHIGQIIYIRKLQKSWNQNQ
ncbi:DltD domain-containing protein [Virgibacillus indicus]|uniref:DltD domain-containing protein n=1 Tax=Virgibacillus indicus TaxID=2024554 RepID=A0A265NF20_9BACI|nr:DinB family protein [Virgibacillus indicus]OZU90642.1 DltD domain-containing protein [Virgibacillus indicus]